MMKIFGIVLILVMFNAQADTEVKLNDFNLPEESIDNPRFTIEGKYKVEEPVAIKPERLVFEERRVSPAEKLKHERLKLEEQNRQMLEKQIENLRIQQEIELTKKLEQTMNATMKAFESLNDKSQYE